MKARRRLRWPVVLALLALGALALLLGACTDVASPRGWASPVLSDSDLLLAAHRDRLYALEPERLVQRWTFPSDSTGPDIDVEALYGAPALTETLVLVPSWEHNRRGAVYALDRQTGLVDWFFKTDEPVIGGVFASEETVFFGSSDGNVYALDIESGAIRLGWPFETGEAVWSTPLLSGDTLYVASLDGRLYAVDADTGVERWSFSTSAGIASPPVLDEEAGLIYVGGFDSQLHAVDTATHEERWALTADNWFWTRPLVADGVVYAGSLDGNVYAIDATTGDPHWTAPFATKAPVRSGVVITNGLLIIIDRDGNVYGVDPEDGAPAFGAPRALGSDVLADPLVIAGDGVASDGADQAAEDVIVVTTNGDLVRIDGLRLQVRDRVALGE